jgi:hypothetical protein
MSPGRWPLWAGRDANRWHSPTCRLILVGRDCIFRRRSPIHCGSWASGPCIRSGALAAIEGVVMRLKNGFDVVLTFARIHRSIAVEADGTDLEPVSSLVQAGARTARF